MKLITKKMIIEFNKIGSQNGLELESKVVAKFTIMKTGNKFYATEFKKSESLLFGVIRLLNFYWASFYFKEAEKASKEELFPLVKRELRFKVKTLREALIEDGFDFYRYTDKLNE